MKPCHCDVPYSDSYEARRIHLSHCLKCGGIIRLHPSDSSQDIEYIDKEVKSEISKRCETPMPNKELLDNLSWLEGYLMMRGDKVSRDKLDFIKSFCESRMDEGYGVIDVPEVITAMLIKYLDLPSKATFEECIHEIIRLKSTPRRVSVEEIEELLIANGIDGYKWHISDGVEYCSGTDQEEEKESRKLLATAIHNLLNGGENGTPTLEDVIACIGEKKNDSLKIEDDKMWHYNHGYNAALDQAQANIRELWGGK